MMPISGSRAMAQLRPIGEAVAGTGRLAGSVRHHMQ